LPIMGFRGPGSSAINCKSTRKSPPDSGPNQKEMADLQGNAWRIHRPLEFWQSGTARAVPDLGVVPDQDYEVNVLWQP